jgi:hypothetical protein
MHVFHDGDDSPRSLKDGAIFIDCAGRVKQESIMFDGLYCDRDNLARLSAATSRSISAENPTGAPSGGGRAEPVQQPDGTWTGGTGARCARALGKGWKVSPSVDIAAASTFTLADIEGPGAIQSIWMTPARVDYRDIILRFYWDDQELPSVECPIGDFFAAAWTSPSQFAQLTSSMICVNPGNAFNCYWPMPFRKRCRITVENRNPEQHLTLYYQVNYALATVPDDAAYFHVQFRRANPLPTERAYMLLDGVEGQGHYVGTYMAWGVNNCGWWGEGEIKFYIDDDIPAGASADSAIAEHGGDCYPTICGTGTEDYFCGSYNFENRATRQYQEFSTPYAGMPHVIRPDGVYQSQTRFSLYRWHVSDPVRFEKRLAVTMQALGWRADRRYLPLQDDIASTVFWYQSLPTAEFPSLPDRDALEII